MTIRSPAELILEVLEQAGVPMNAGQLASHLHIKESEMEGFNRRGRDGREAE
jgi:hypothetical protein